MLIALVEVLSGEKCQGKYHKVPEKDIHKLENITIAIEFVSKFVRPLNVNSNGKQFSLSLFFTTHLIPCHHYRYLAKEP